MVRPSCKTEHPCEGWEPATEEEWERFWLLVKFEAEHEPDRVDYYEQLDDLERARRRSRLKELAASAPLPPHGTGLTVEQALATLAGVRRAGSTSWMAQCPVHEDGSPSLHITESERWPGEVIVHCFAGCDWKDIKNLLRSRVQQ